MDLLELLSDAGQSLLSSPHGGDYHRRPEFKFGRSRESLAYIVRLRDTLVC